MTRLMTGIRNLTQIPTFSLLPLAISCLLPKSDQIKNINPTCTLYFNLKIQRDLKWALDEFLHQSKLAILARAAVNEHKMTSCTGVLEFMYCVLIVIRQTEDHPIVF